MNARQFGSLPFGAAYQEPAPGAKPIKGWTTGDRYQDAICSVLLWESTNPGGTMHLDIQGGQIRVVIEGPDREYTGKGPTFLDALEGCRDDGWRG